MKKKILTAFVVLLMAAVSGCVQESETVDPAAVFNPATGSDPGTTEMSAYLSSPSDSSNNVDPDANIIIAFSKDVAAASLPGNLTVNGSISGPVSYTANVTGNIVEIDPDSPFNFGETIEINLNASIQSTTGDPLANIEPLPLPWEFYIISELLYDPSAIDDPYVVPATQSPTGQGVLVTTLYVQVTFSEPVDVLTVTTSADGTTGSFTISPAVGASCFESNPAGNTWRLNFGGTNLAYGTTYTVTLTSDIDDVDDNLPLLEDGQHTWSFETENDALPTPVAIEPNSVYVNNVTGTNAVVHWTTNKPVPDTGCTIDFGVDTSYASSDTEGITGTGFTVHSYDFNTLGALAENTKYYYRITVDDGATTDTITGSFFTGSVLVANNSGQAVKDDSGNNSGLELIQNTGTTGTENGSSVAAWINDIAGDIYGYHFDTSGPPTIDDWGVDGSPLDTNGSTNVRLSRDGLGYVVVTCENGGTIYAKRIRDNAGTLEFDANWAADAAAAGVSVALGSSPSATLTWGQVTANNVYGGFVTKIVSGTATMNIPTNPFYDFANDLQTGIAAGDHIMDGSYNHTTVGALSTNFRHVIGQTAATVAATETYYIASNTTTVSGTATNHLVNNSTAPGQLTYNNGAANIYTQHGFTGTFSSNDLVEDGAGNWGRVTGASFLFFFSGISIHVGPLTTDGTSAGNLVDSSQDFSGTGLGINLYEMVYNTTTTSYSYVNDLTSAASGILGLANDIFVLGDGYEIYSGEYCATHPTTGVTSSFTTIPVNPSGILSNGEAFTIYDGITTGTADTPPGNPLYDDNLTSGVDDYATLGVVANDVVINTTDYAGLPHPNIAKVRTFPFAVAERALDLDTGIMADGETYELLRFADHTQSANILETGSATAYSASQLVDGSNGDFVTVSVSKGDLVYNITDNTYAVVTADPSLPTGEYTLDLNKDIFDNGNEEYLVFASNEPLIETGSVITAGNPFTDSNASFTNVQVGDVVYNQDTGAEAQVTAKTATTLTLTSNIMNTVGHHYIVIQPRVLFAYINGGDILGELIGLRDGTSQGSSIICNNADTMANVYTRPTHDGQALVVYEDNSNGQVYGKRLNISGTILVGGVAGNRGVSVTGAGTFDILDAQVWDNGTSSWIYVLYANGTTIYLARLNQNFADAGLTEWTYSAAGTNGAFTIDSFGNPILTYVDAAGDIIVTKRDAGDDGTEVNTETISTSLITTEILSLSIVPDGSEGAIIAWADDRYYTVHGYVVMAQRVDNSGNALWDSDAGALTDYTGIIAGITETNDNLEVTVEQAWYNGGSVILWYDYRNIRTDIFYQAITTAGVPQY